MTNLSKLAELMKSDWNRRIGHDYRFWMSDGHRDDQAMWEAGKRDYDILLAGVTDRSRKTLLDLGCGVGRLLKPALADFQKVIGIDVSDIAIGKARSFLGEPKLELHTGNGLNLEPVENASVDVVISFAALTSMPTAVIARYLKEIHRVLRPEGEVRLQVYLGKEQPVEICDTLHLRCFEKENFIAAVTAAGFQLVSIDELVLPIQVSFREIGIEAMIASLVRESRAPASEETIASCLLPSGEAEPDGQGSSGQIECWMTVNYAKELTERGDFEKARAAVELAYETVSTASIDVRDMLDRVVAQIEKGESSKCEAIGSDLTGQGQQEQTFVSNRGAAEMFERNMRALEDRFPEVARVVSIAACDPQIEVRTTEEGPVLHVAGQCLDHPQKPKTAAAAWLKRALDEKRLSAASSIGIFGFGAGYHVEALLSEISKPVVVVEPSASAFKAALGARDLTKCIDSLQGLVIGEPQSLALLDEESELIVRPQTQALHNGSCSVVKSLFYGKRGLASLHPKIGILGPTQGGTLPITFYVQNALASMKQRSRLLDMSGFAAGYHQMERFVTESTRQASLQGTYIEMLSQVVLESVTERPVDILICMAQAPLSGRVLSELRRRGVITVLWFMEDYLRFTYWKSMAQFYDFVFTIQTGDCLTAIRGAGAGEAHYLPIGCDPGIHVPLNLPLAERQRWGSPISFVGAGYHNRQQMFASLADMPLKIWGTEWPGCRPFDRLVQENGRRISPEEYVKIFNSSEINLNLHSSTERDGVDPSGDFVNPRTFELAACGAFQLVDERKLLPPMFQIGKEVATFDSTQDLKQKIAYYLAKPEERARMSAAARTRAITEHTYEQRLRQMLSVIYSSKYEHLRQREKDSPWTKVLSRAEKHPELSRRCQAAFERGEEANLDGLISDIVTGNGKLSPTEQKLLFLFHIRKQIIRMNTEDRTRS